MLGGLTRGLDLSLLDDGIGMVDGRCISFFPRGDAMGVVLPSNSPGVHSLWAPATVLKMPLVLKPGSAEPWTPLRMIQAWLKAGVPARGVRLLPDRSRRRQRDPAVDRPRHGVRRRRVDRSAGKADGRVESPRPGLQQGVIGPDVLADWEQYIDVIAASIVEQRRPLVRQRVGRVGDGKHADEIAEALAKKLAAITPRAADDRTPVLAPFVDPGDREAHLGD